MPGLPTGRKTHTSLTDADRGRTASNTEELETINQAEQIPMVREKRSPAT
jgi:hypothetical protein